MIFAYNNLNIEVNLKKKGKNRGVANHLLSVAANTVMHANNPDRDNTPTRRVHFRAERDMNKGFINILIKSVLAGAKESILPSKKNRKLSSASQ